MHKKGSHAAGAATAAAAVAGSGSNSAAASFKVNATPFVPSGSQGPPSATPTAATAVGPVISTPGANFKVSATPFVPGAATGQQTPSTVASVSSRPGQPINSPAAQLTLSAQPFVPAATRAASTPNATSSAITTLVPGHIKQQSTTASSPHRGRTPAGTMPASPAASNQSGASTAAAAASPPVTGRGMGRSGRGPAGAGEHTHQGHQGGRGRAGTGPRAVGFSPTDNYPTSPGMGLVGRGPMLVGQAGGSLGSPAMSPVPPRLPGYRPMHGKPQTMGRTPLSRQFLDEKLKQQLAAASYTIHAQWTKSAKDGFHFTLPERVAQYHTLLPLEHPAASNHTGNAEGFSHALGLRTFVIKGISSMDGQPYVLRRVDGKQVVPSQDVLSCALQAVDTWAPLAAHPHIVALRSAFVSSEVESTSAQFFVYDYHPGSVTLAAAHLTPAVGAGGMVTVQPPTEAQLWSYLVQLTSVLRAAHMHGLTIRPCSLHASKVLVSPTGRVRVNCCGMLDAIAGDATQEREDMSHAHRLDLMALGQLLLCLACAGLVPSGHGGSLDVLGSPAGAARVSPELCRLIAALLAAPDGGMLGNVRQLCSHPAVVEHTMMELEASHSMQDMLVHELSKECENGRLLRLLVKLGFVVERPQGDVDGSWAETGDRYLLKLFRDFVFHQRVPEGHPGAGGPLLDWGYVLEALNKLDAGVPERIMLLARDETAMLIASYADIKRCVESSYSDLQTRSS